MVIQESFCTNTVLSICAQWCPGFEGHSQRLMQFLFFCCPLVCKCRSWGMRKVQGTGITEEVEDHLRVTFCKWGLVVRLGSLSVSAGNFYPGLCPLFLNWYFYSLLRSSVLSSYCHTHHHLIFCYGYCSLFQTAQASALGGRPHPFCIGQNKESGYFIFSLINIKLGVLAGKGQWGSNVGHVGSQEPAGGLEGELQRLSKHMIREKAWSVQLTAHQACPDSAFSNRRQSWLLRSLPTPF
jgi:hypothetical protein